LLPLGHRIDFRGDSKLQVAVKFGAVNFRRELSQIPPCVIISKIALEQVFIAFDKALFRKQKILQSITMRFISFREDLE